MQARVGFNSFWNSGYKEKTALRVFPDYLFVPYDYGYYKNI